MTDRKHVFYLYAANQKSISDLFLNHRELGTFIESEANFDLTFQLFPYKTDRYKSTYFKTRNVRSFVYMCKMGVEKKGKPILPEDVVMMG
jgi:hypothetical protein